MKTAIEIMSLIFGLTCTVAFVLLIGSISEGLVGWFAGIWLGTGVLFCLTVLVDFIYKRGLKDGEQDDEHGRK